MLLFKTPHLLKHGSRNPDYSVADDTPKKSKRLKESTEETSEDTDGLQELPGPQDAM